MHFIRKYAQIVSTWEFTFNNLDIKIMNDFQQENLNCLDEFSFKREQNRLNFITFLI